MGGINDAWAKKINPDTATNGYSRYSFVSPNVTAKASYISKLASQVSSSSSTSTSYNDYSTEASTAETLANVTSVITALGTLGVTGYSLWQMGKSGSANGTGGDTTTSAADYEKQLEGLDESKPKDQKKKEQVMANITSDIAKLGQTIIAKGKEKDKVSEELAKQRLIAEGNFPPGSQEEKNCNEYDKKIESLKGSESLAKELNDKVSGKTPQKTSADGVTPEVWAIPGYTEKTFSSDTEAKNFIKKAEDDFKNAEEARKKAEEDKKKYVESCKLAAQSKIPTLEVAEQGLDTELTNLTDKLTELQNLYNANKPGTEKPEEEKPAAT